MPINASRILGTTSCGPTNCGASITEDCTSAVATANGDNVALGLAAPVGGGVGVAAVETLRIGLGVPVGVNVGGGVAATVGDGIDVDVAVAIADCV